MGRTYFKVKETDIDRVEYTIIDDSASSCEKELLTSFFDKYDVPEEYRYIFFYRSLINNDIREFITDTPLVHTKYACAGQSYKKADEKGNDLVHFYILRNISSSDKEAIHKYFFRMDENNYMDRYLKALNEYFILRMDTYSINRVSDSEDILNDKRRFIKKTIKENKKK
jgi:hypothetical protein